jgi:hypothetical protein
VRELAPLPERNRDLLPANRDVVLAGRKLGAGARLLEYNCVTMSRLEKKGSGAAYTTKRQ